MINKFLRVLWAVSFSLLCINSYGQREHDIKDFYVRYMRNLDRGADVDNDSLCAKFLTPELRVKLSDYIEEADCDPIIRAQDVSRYAIGSLSVESLGKGWYMVRYRWSNESDCTEIPLKACDCGGVVKITYITPVRLGSQYGDRLLED